MMGRAGRLLVVLTAILATWLLAGAVTGAPQRPGASTYAFDEPSAPKTCAEVNPAWSEAAIDLTTAEPPIEPGRVFRLSDGTIAVLVVITATNADGQATSFDFSASIRVSGVILRAADDGAFIPFDPPVRNASGLSTPDEGGIDGIAFCYRVSVPNPPQPGATPEPTNTPVAEASPPIVTASPTATATATAEAFDVGAVQTANALATEAAEARATADAASTAAAASEATRQAEAAAAEATVAALATAQAEQNATVAAQATSDAAAATTAAEEQAALQATASAEVAAAQATTAALATADAARESELATARAVQTEAAATIAVLQAPTETPTPTATPSPTETPTPTETPVPTVTPSPTATETLFYGVPENEGFDAWAASLPPGWSVSPDGHLTSDGSPFQGYVQPPRTVNRDNYAVEAEIRIVEEPGCAANFGILVRGSESGFYAGGVEWVCNAGSSVRLWALNTVLAEHNRPIDQEWHTYRIAVNGDQITFSFDGKVVLEATDASFPSGGQIALWSNGVKLDVRAFRVYVES